MFFSFLRLTKLKQEHLASDAQALKSMTIPLGKDPPHQTLWSGCTQQSH